MTDFLLSENITCISELKKNPGKFKSNKSTCVLSHNKPAYYMVHPLEYARLLRIEKEFNSTLYRGE